MVRQRLVSLLIAATLLLSGCFIRDPNGPDAAGLAVFNGNVFIVDEATQKVYLVFCQSLGQGVTTDEPNINDNRIDFIGGGIPQVLVFVENLASFNFSKCKQVFVSDNNSNGNFEPLAAELTGKLSCDTDIQNVNGETDGTAKLVVPGPTATSGGGHHKKPSATASTVIELFSSNDNLECFSFPTAVFPFGPFSTSQSQAASSSVTAQKFNELAPKIRKFLKNHPGGR